MKKIKIKQEDLPKIRKPIAPPQKAHKDKSKYDRKEKHKKKIVDSRDFSLDKDI